MNDEGELDQLRVSRLRRLALKKLLWKIAITTILGVAATVSALKTIELYRNDVDEINPQAAPATLPPPLATRSNMIGTWADEENNETIQFALDRTFAATVRDGTVIVCQMRGKWQEDGETVVLKTTSVDGKGERFEGPKNIYRMNVEVPLTIISRTEPKITIRLKSGRELTWFRVTIRPN